MSRTYKDKPAKFRFPELFDKTENKTKKPKLVDTDWHWLSSTPSWWTRLMMNRPLRREQHLLEHEAALTPLEDLEDLDIPNTKRKPHVYYY